MSVEPSPASHFKWIDTQGAVELATSKVLNNYSHLEMAIVEATEKAAEQAGVTLYL